MKDFNLDILNERISTQYTDMKGILVRLFVAKTLPGGRSYLCHLKTCILPSFVRPAHTF